MKKTRTASMRKAANTYYQKNKDLVIARVRQWRIDNPERVLANANAWRKANPERRQEIALKHRLKKRYGVDVETYFTLFAFQQGLCAICKQPETNTTASNKVSTLLAVDHNHTTGRIRSLLCKGCNLAIGSMQELPERLEAAAAYLREHNHDTV